MCSSNAFKFRCRWFGNCLIETTNAADTTVTPPARPALISGFLKSLLGMTSLHPWARRAKQHSYGDLMLISPSVFQKRKP